eukprot:scaffold307_cov390-Prasinococcus_capsulatus_cf.AAC.33
MLTAKHHQDDLNDASPRRQGMLRPRLAAERCGLGAWRRAGYRRGGCQGLPSQRGAGDAAAQLQSGPRRCIYGGRALIRRGDRVGPRHAASPVLRRPSLGWGSKGRRGG